MVNLQDIFVGVYDRASYDLRLDYTQAMPPPALTETEKQWIETLLQSFQ